MCHTVMAPSLCKNKQFSDGQGQRHMDTEDQVD